MFSLQVSGATDSEFATCLATLEDHLHTGVGGAVRRGPMVVKRSDVKTVQSDASFANDLEEAFAENEHVDVDALSLLEFVGDQIDDSSSEALVPVFTQNKRVHFKVVYTHGGNMRLPTIPLASGRRLTSADIVVTVHESASELPECVSSIDRPQFVSGCTSSRMGLLCLHGMKLESLQEHSMQWKPGKKKYMIHGIVATEDNINVITELVQAAAITTATGPSAIMRIAKDDPASSGLLQSVREFAEMCPTYMTRLENTNVHERWCISLEGTNKLELLHQRIEPSHVFKLPPALPMIQDMTSFQLALFLENHCRFSWVRLPKKTADREALSFRPTDAQCPRVWCSSGRGKMDHYYLQALASASEELALAIAEVVHAQTRSYYMGLLGLEDQKKVVQKLAIDDGDGDFPAAPAAKTRAREPLLI